MKRLFFIVLLLSSFGASAQIYTDINTYGYNWNRGYFRQAFRVPNSNILKFNSTTDSAGALLFNPDNGTLYVNDGSGWVALGTGGATYLPGWGLTGTTTFNVDTGANKIPTKWYVDNRFYTKTQINSFFAGTAVISGYNKPNWDNVYAAYAAAQALSPAGWATQSALVDTATVLRAIAGGGGGSGDMTKAVYDADNNGIVDDAELLNGHPSTDFLTGNQTITLSNDVSGSGATSISSTVTGLRGVSLPSLSVGGGTLKYTGTGTNTWVFDANNYTLKIDSVTTNSDSTILRYWANGSSHDFYNFRTGLTGNDTTIFNTVIDSTGQPGQRVLYASGNKIKSTPYFIFDSANRKLVIGNTNISVGGPNTKLWVTGNANITGNLTANSFIKTGGTSSQFLKADGSVDANTYLTTSTAASTYQTLANLTTSTSLGTSNTLYPSQNAVKTYVDNVIAGGTAPNIYNSNGTISANRTVSLSSNILYLQNSSTNRTGFGSTFSAQYSNGTRDIIISNSGSEAMMGSQPTSGIGTSSNIYARDSAFIKSQNTSGPESWITIDPNYIALRPYNGDLRAVIGSGVGTKAVRYDPSTQKFTYADTTTGGGSGTVNSGTQYRIGYYAGTGSAISEAPAITASRALISDANGVPTHATTTATQIGYLSTTTSDVQTQINSKEATFTETAEEFTGSTSSSITLSNTPKSGKAEMYYLNGIVIKISNVSRTGTSVTLSGFTRESSDVITAKYSY